jgi:hypothetical protein
VLSLNATPAKQAPVQCDFVGRHGSVPDALGPLDCGGCSLNQLLGINATSIVQTPIYSDSVGQRREVL